jgi:hypothetical protein
MEKRLRLWKKLKKEGQDYGKKAKAVEKKKAKSKTVEKRRLSLWRKEG